MIRKRQFIGVLAVATVATLALSGCAGLSGYPADPQNSANLTDLRTIYFEPTSEQRYVSAAAADRRGIRDEIVLKRIQIYDMEFSLFARDLSGATNSISLGSDLAALALNGLGATAGNAATKAALAAASGGVIAANGSIDKDLFYQKTVPAIIAQMQANRTKVEATILAGLQKTDAEYPLQRADLDLDVLNDAGSLNGAVSEITQAANESKNTSQVSMDAFRSLAISESASTSKLNAWLFPSGLISVTNVQALQAWLKAYSDPNFHDMSVETFVDGTSDDIEKARQQALADKSLAIK